MHWYYDIHNKEGLRYVYRGSSLREAVECYKKTYPRGEITKADAFPWRDYSPTNEEMKVHQRHNDKGLWEVRKCWSEEPSKVTTLEKVPDEQKLYTYLYRPVDNNSQPCSWPKPDGMDFWLDGTTTDQAYELFRLWEGNHEKECYFIRGELHGTSFDI